MILGKLFLQLPAWRQEFFELGGYAVLLRVVPYSPYDILNLLLTSMLRQRRRCLSVIASFIESVIAGIVAYYLCKWLDRFLS